MRYVSISDRHLQPPAAIIFRGKGKRISKAERASWDERVHVYFQPRAWYNGEVGDEWTVRTLAPCTSHGQNKKNDPSAVEESVIFTDNLKTQTKRAWRRLLWKVGRCKSHLFPTGVTDEIQTIDDCIGQMTKTHMGKSHTEWLEATAEDGRTNLDRMLAGEVTASERRTLLTKFLGDAWDYVLANFDVLHSGEKNGCCLDKDGQFRTKIRLQGFEGDYDFGPEDHGPEATSSADEEEGSDSDVEQSEANGDGNVVDGDIEVTDEGEATTDESSSDSDGEGPSNVDDNGHFKKPDGWTMLSDPPEASAFTIANLRALGMWVALKWPYGDEFGWEIGEFVRVIDKGKYKGCYEIHFEDDIEYFWPKEPNSEYGPSRKWVLLTPELEPEAEED